MKSQKRYNLIIIVSDTLRQDHLGCYGNDWIKTPSLDNFSKKSIVFDNFYLSSFPTMPARADLYTGKWSFTYLGWAPMPRDEKILPQILKDAGYTTMGVVDTPFYIRNGYNYDRGFDDFIEVHGQLFDYTIKHGQVGGLEHRHAVHGWRYREARFAPRTFMKARHLLEQHYKDDNPFFLLVDTWDPHEPWDAPSWYTELYLPDYDGQIILPSYGQIEKEDIKKAQACYCGEITMVDEEVGIFLRQLENMKLMENTIVVFLSDHGFYFGEHGIFGKSIIKAHRWYRSPLYEEINRIPLMVYHPDEEPKRINVLTSLIDLMPTILDMLEVEKPETVQGKSMIQAIQGQPFEGRDFVISSLPLYNPGDITKVVDAFERKVVEYSPSTITTLNWSLLYSMEKEKPELYNLKKDPNQKENIIDEHPNIAQQLHKKFLSVLESSKIDQRLLDIRKKITI